MTDSARRSLPTAGQRGRSFWTPDEGVAPPPEGRAHPRPTRSHRPWRMQPGRAGSFQEVCLDAYRCCCKGCTTYRPSAITGSVLEFKAADCVEPVVPGANDLMARANKLTSADLQSCVCRTANTRCMSRPATSIRTARSGPGATCGMSARWSPPSAISSSGTGSTPGSLRRPQPWLPRRPFTHRRNHQRPGSDRYVRSADSRALCAKPDA